MCIGLANLIVVLHWGLILLSLWGATAAMRGRFAAAWPLPLWQKLYLASAAAVSLSGLLHGDCLLTTWEKKLRGQVHPGLAYEGTFLGHYLPFLPEWVVEYGTVLLAFAAFVGAVQAGRRWAHTLRGECPTRS